MDTAKKQVDALKKLARSAVANELDRLYSGDPWEEFFTALSTPAAADAPEPEELQCNVCDGEPGLRVLGSRAWAACSACHGSGRTDVLGPYVPGTSRKKPAAAPTPSKGEA